MQIETSSEIDQIAPALITAQGAIGTVALNKTNPHFRSRYADLSAIREACRQPLADNGLAVIQSPATSEGKVVLTTMLLHKSGQWLRSSLNLKPERAETPQAIGSAITYARRYTMSALLGIVADEDDDGNAASAGRTNQASTTSKSSSAKFSPQGRQSTAIDKKSKVIFDKGNVDFVSKISQELEKKGCSNHLKWIINDLHGKEMRAGIVAETIERRIENLKNDNLEDNNPNMANSSDDKLKQTTK